MPASPRGCDHSGLQGCRAVGLLLIMLVRRLSRSASWCRRGHFRHRGAKPGCVSGHFAPERGRVCPLPRFRPATRYRGRVWLLCHRCWGGQTLCSFCRATVWQALGEAVQSVWHRCSPRGVPIIPHSVQIEQHCCCSGRVPVIRPQIRTAHGSASQAHPAGRARPDRAGRSRSRSRSPRRPAGGTA